MSTTPMQPPPPGAATVPAGARRTRPADRYTEIFLVLTAFFGAWGIALFVLTLLAITQPAFLYSDAKNLLKALGATVVGLLAISQAVTMNMAMGLIPRGGVRMRTLMRTHRYGGRIAILLAVAVAIFCLLDRGAPTDPFPRVALHAFFGSTSFAALAIKLGLLRFRPTLAYTLAPWLGWYIAIAFVVIWITSAYAYFTGTL